MNDMRGLIEMGVVFLFAIGWGVIELVCLRFDRQRREREQQEARETSSVARHPEGQQALHPALPETGE